MAQPRTLVVLPPDLVKEIDRLVGPRRRSAFVIELAQRELKRRHLLKVLDDETPIWRDEDHPEMGRDSDAWVRGMRQGSDARLAPKRAAKGKR